MLCGPPNEFIEALRTPNDNCSECLYDLVSQAYHSVPPKDGFRADTKSCVPTRTMNTTKLFASFISDSNSVATNAGRHREPSCTSFHVLSIGLIFYIVEDDEKHPNGN